ncbi:MAG: sigma 54-interacting transcriptional regulator [Thermodesulfovibrio sp.]|nr:sigma 54-interacting transcriptional regulator [Thermodesulfovibrio sp.]MCX7724748.1 sigma 54-interacting transcriptional regulator [Thermodesulfovibrio sp.]
MSLPVFQHTVSKFRELLVGNSDKISVFIKYDPMIAYLIFNEVNKPCGKTQITNFSQMVNYIGTKKIEQIIIERDFFLEVEDLYIWAYGVLSAEISSLMAEKFFYIQKDEAFFAGLLPCLGLLFMINDFPKYKKLIHFLIKLPIEDRVFLEQSVFGTNHIDTLRRNIMCPPFREVVNILNKIFPQNGLKDIKTSAPQKGSALKSYYDMALLSDLSSYGAQALLFPSVVDNRELFLELAKRYFRIKEYDSMEILQNAMDRFISISKEFNILEEIQLSTERFYELRKFRFETKNPVFANMLKNLFEENAKDRNIFIYGERAVGKRLLAAALYYAENNPRRGKPLVMIFCDMEEEILEEEFFGIKEGYLGKEGKRGVLRHAEGGTLVIKEFDSMPESFQKKFQKAIQNGKFYRVGDITPIDFPDIKFILIGKEDIRIKVAKGEFSGSLLKLLNPIFFRIPPLRERREDIFYIAEEIVRKYNLDIIKEKLKEPEVVNKLKTAPFPNNLRDLKIFLFLLYIQKILNS